MPELKNEQEPWEHYKKSELTVVGPLLAEIGFTLEEKQPHLLGERYLMQAVTTQSGRKFILLARKISDNRRVVIKITRDADGARELEHERICRDVLKRINFAYQTFLSPEEILFTKRNGYTIHVQAFIEQEQPFLERPTEEQFAFALSAFKAQESAHATTYRHLKLINASFGSLDASGYLKNFRDFVDQTLELYRENPNLEKILRQSQHLLETNRYTIDQYCGFLTHTDFVPHNIRIAHGAIYLLDHASLRFGNKYEGWARFVNFMTLYNPALESALLRYVADNRTSEESLSLKLMRVYRLGEIIYYYSSTLAKTSGNLNTLNKKRIHFWSSVLNATLQDQQVKTEVIEEYKKERNLLRSDEEKERQVGLH